MKKLYVFLAIFLSIFTVVEINQALNNNNLIASSSSVTTTTLIQTTDPEDNTFYDVYNSMVSELYEQVYDDLYSSVYQDILDEINQEYYDQIYAQVEADLSDLLSEEEFEIYLGEFQQQIHDVIALADQSVLGVSANNETEGSIGTGVVYKYDDVNDLYYIVTNYHVIEGMTNYSVYFENEETFDATLIGSDEIVDIAVLTFTSLNLPIDVQVATLGDSDISQVGEFILAIGHPTGYRFYNSATLGIISGLDRVVDANEFVDYIQHDAAINSGNSGGPIYNLDGEVIGINVIKYATVDIEGMGFSIPINLVKTVIQTIENNQ